MDYAPSANAKNQCAESPTSCRETELAAASCRLSAIVAGLQDQLQRLHERLGPVMRPAVPQIKSDAKVPQIGAPFAQFLDEQGSKLYAINSGLNDLLDRLEV